MPGRESCGEVADVVEEEIDHTSEQVNRRRALSFHQGWPLFWLLPEN
jgi:hypothetical protein